MTEQAARATGRHVGFVLTASDPYFLLDLDGQRDPITGEWTEAAHDVAKRFAGAGMEISISGTGMHVIGSCDQSLLADRKNKWGGGKFEFYTQKRFIAFGDTGLTGDVHQDCTVAALEFVPMRDAVSSAALPETGPVPEYTGPADDAELIRMMMQARGSIAAMFGNKAPLPALWNGDGGVLSRFYPSETSEFDRSAADAALCAHLAFWTGKDVSRIERLWLQSPLAASRDDRKKLDRPDYRTMTVTGAAERCSAVYQRPSAVPVLPGADVPDTPVTHGAYLTTPEQLTHFAGCVYVEEDHMVLVPDGSLLKAEQFRVRYGGHEFQMEAGGTRPTRDAFEAFTQNRSHKFPQARCRRYWPDVPFGTIRDGEVNVFRIPEVVTSDEPVDRFLDLVRKLLPDEHDRSVLLAWMASAAQNRGVKFQWAVVLQGTEGNGKTFLLKCMEYAIGQSVSHLPNPEDMGEKYNGYIEGNLFVGVEEIHMAGRREVLDRLKKYVTNDRIEIRTMRNDKRMADNLTNWMFLTNYQDAVLKSRNDRRYAIFFTAQQSHDDLARDGMGGSYFPRLWEWARNGGFAAVAGYLRRCEIPAELDPAGDCHRAPHTSSTNAAIEQSLGALEQSILVAIDEETPGFRGGWISSVRLRDWMRENGFTRLADNVIRGAIRNIGYEPCHLWLRGRPGGIIPEERGKRPVLYCNAETQKSVKSLDDYINAQGYLAPGTNIVKLPTVER